MHHHHLMHVMHLYRLIYKIQFTKWLEAWFHFIQISKTAMLYLSKNQLLQKILSRISFPLSNFKDTTFTHLSIMKFLWLSSSPFSLSCGEHSSFHWVCRPSPFERIEFNVNISKSQIY